MSYLSTFHAVREALTQQPERVRALYYVRDRRDARVQEVIALAKSEGIRFEAVDRAWLDARIEGATEQGRGILERGPGRGHVGGGLRHARDIEDPIGELAGTVHDPMLRRELREVVGQLPLGSRRTEQEELLAGQ